MIKFPLGRNLANKDKCCKETLLSVKRSDFSPTEGVDGGLYHPSISPLTSTTRVRHSHWTRSVETSRSAHDIAEAYDPGLYETKYPY